MMPERFRILAGEIRLEIQRFQRVHDHALRAMERAEALPDERQFYIESAALSIHSFSFYGGVENIFRGIATTVDDSVPTGAESHRALLAQIAADVRDVRPPVISPSSRNALSQLLGFRHVVRHVYSDALEATGVELNANLLAATAPRLIDELMSFADWLDATAQQG